MKRVMLALALASGLNVYSADAQNSMEKNHLKVDVVCYTLEGRKPFSARIHGTFNDDFDNPGISGITVLPEGSKSITLKNAKEADALESGWEPGVTVALLLPHGEAAADTPAAAQQGREMKAAFSQKIQRDADSVTVTCTVTFDYAVMALGVPKGQSSRVEKRLGLSKGTGILTVTKTRE